MMQQPNPIDTFLQEAADLLEEIEQTALRLDEEPGDREAVNQLFRAFHTIKGSGGMFGLDELSGFTHHVETVLGRVREGRLPVTRELTELILEARDHIQSLLAPPGSARGPDRGGRIVAALVALSGATAEDTPPGEATPREAEPPAPGTEAVWRIRFAPNPDLLASGTNPAWILDELRALGRAEITGHTDRVPALDTIQPDGCYLWWDIVLVSSAGRDAIGDVFLFVADASRVEIAAAPAEAPAPGPPEREPTAGAAHPAPSGDSTVRVPSEKLDRLVTLVGELVMNQSRLVEAAAIAGSPELTAPVEEIERLIAELRDNVLGIRMMPIGRTFSRFKRLVHDLSAELSKEIELVTEGAETELDKTVLDQLGEPLVHLIRNSIDHGIEAPAERQRLGKPARGTIRLSAAHTGSNVVVSIADDGRGLDAAAIRAQAVARRLIPPDAPLSETEAFHLIFLPGFSTASEVTSVSGRGVGMDVVRRQVEMLRGSVAVSSTAGRGATVSLTLPLTLAIIDGLRVEVAGDSFILPMSMVMENVELPGAVRLARNGRNLIAVRGELVPYVDLRELFELPGSRPAIEKVVIVRHGDTRVGIVVDRVAGTHQTVIQSLGGFYRQVEVASGATIMGDGSVALILDVHRLVQFADRRSRPETVAAPKEIR